MNHKGHENEKSDRKPKKLLIVKQILLIPILENVQTTFWRKCILMSRCKWFISENPSRIASSNFPEVISCYFLPLRTPDLGYDWKTNTGRVFNYFCFGAACSEVEIDCLTGDHQVCQ